MKPFCNTIGVHLIPIPAGSFTMGGDRMIEQADDVENPRHKVSLPTPFYMGEHPITQSQWSSVMGDNPSHFRGDDRPVEKVSWDDVHLFIQKLNTMETLSHYRLPTEAEWEYAARGQTGTTFFFGNDDKDLAEYAWYQRNANQETHPVGQLKPNPFGLLDIYGNVHEWCSDWYHKAYYAESPSRSPQGPSKGFARVSRGGDWGSDPWYCRSASRSCSSASRRGNRLGFRLVMDVT